MLKHDRQNNALGGFAPSRALGGGKQVIFAEEARRKLLQGSEKLTKALEVTLGPSGRCVIVDNGFGAPRITKDGVTVANSVTLSDRAMDSGCQLVKSVAQKTNDEAGDGTTTATVLTHAILSESIKSVSAGVNPTVLRKGILDATAQVVAELDRNSMPIKTNERIEQVATISANGDKQIGGLIAQAIDKVGADGVITVEDGRTLKDDLDVIEGMKLNEGYISSYFINNAKTRSVELENVSLLLVGQNISSAHSLIPILEVIAREGRSLLIVANDVEGEALAMLIVNNLRGVCKCAAIKCPGFGENQKATLEDISVVSGGTIISEETGTKLDKVTAAQLGRARKVTIDQNGTIILNGDGKKEQIASRAEMVKGQIKEATSEYQKDKLKESLARLTGGVAVIKVGGVSAVEVSEKKDRVTDALHAALAAESGGVVAGGGAALLHASKKITPRKDCTFDEKLGYEIVKKACKIPCKTIVENSGGEGGTVCDKIIAEKDVKSGYNAATGLFTNMFKDGILDATKVVKSAIENAASIGSIVSTCEAAVIDEGEEEAGSNQR